MTNKPIPFLLFFICVHLCTSVVSISFADEDKARIAVFPLGGDVAVEVREKIGFSLRAKLDRAGTYEVIDGPTMADLVANLDKPIGLASSLEDIRKLSKDADAEIMIWGDATKSGVGYTISLKAFDMLQPDPLPREIVKEIKQPTDLRFAVEAILEKLADARKFEHPDESAVSRDANAERLWKENPNLVVNGSFDEPGKWWGILRSEKYEISTKDDRDIDRVVIQKENDNSFINFKLSEEVATTNGLACLSSPIEIKPKTRYRIAFRYRSDGPVARVFVKGYSADDKEIYRRQVPPGGPTNGEWKKVECDLNPQNVSTTVKTLRVDLYAYLGKGTIDFDDVVLKEVGEPTRIARDDAIDKSTTQRAR